MDDNLYIIDKDSKNQSVFDKVINFSYKKDEYGNEKLDIDLENNNGYASTEELVRILKEDVFRISRSRFFYFIVFLRLVLLRIPIFRHNS